MDKRILAGLVAVLAGAGSASAQPAGTAGTAAENDGYVISGAGALVNSARQCVHTGYWTPALAAAPCDTVPRASVPAPVVAAAPEPPPAAAVAPAAPPPRVIEKVTLSTDVLFPFNKAELLPGGKEKLDDLAKSAQNAEVERIVIAGYADRIGSEQYNRELSQRRAEAVAAYLASRGVDESRIQAEGRGEDNPITGDQCKRMGPERASNRKLVSCLQPDRRVEAELLGTREAASGTTGSASGASATGTGGASGGGSQ